MTRKKSVNNRKKNNKITVYLTDALREYLASEVQATGKNRSLIVQDALILRRDKAE